MQRFGHQNDLIDMPFLDGIIQCANGMNTESRQPIAIFLEGFEQGGVIVHRQHFGWRMPSRESDDEGIIQHIKVEPLKVTGRGHHVAVVIVAGFISTVKHQVFAFSVL